MKRLSKVWLLIVCIAAMLVGTTACSGVKLDPQQLLQRWERVVELCGKTQITPDAKLIGTRTYGENAYVGTYYADCKESSGRDVVFGGASLQERTVHLQGHVEQTSGAVCLRIRLGKEVQELKPDAQGNFEGDFVLTGGGNYFMLDYEHFCGTVTLTAFEHSAEESTA